MNTRMLALKAERLEKKTRKFGMSHHSMLFNEPLVELKRDLQIRQGMKDSFEAVKTKVSPVDTGVDNGVCKGKGLEFWLKNSPTGIALCNALPKQATILGSVLSAILVAEMAIWSIVPEAVQTITGIYGVPTKLLWFYENFPPIVVTCLFGMFTSAFAGCTAAAFRDEAIRDK